jgi:uncharacterized protein (DUF697 family)
MTQTSSSSNPVHEAIAAVVSLASDWSYTLTAYLAGSVSAASQAAGPDFYRLIEQTTETLGGVVTPIAENPVVKFATKLPFVHWLMAAVGQVDVETIEKDVAELRYQYPMDTVEELAHRVITESAFQAARVGLITNLAPPLALMLLAVDLTAIAALQADMIYRIAAIYGFHPNEATRRGEVLVIWGLSASGSSVLKTGLSPVELLPLIGTAVGITSNALILYTLGRTACLFYEEKQKL